MHYHVIRSIRRKKTITLKIDRRGKILIYAPYMLSEDEIDEFYRKHASWIEKNILKTRITYKSFEHGEEFFYLGKGYPLYYTDEGEAELKLKDGAFLLNKYLKPLAKDMFIKWYRERAYEILLEIVYYFSRLMGVFPNNVRVTNALKRFGSCSTKNSICFSFRVVMAPFNVVEYIVVHELCHILEKNHSKIFWQLVHKFIPDYKARKLWLKKHAYALTLD